MGSDGEGAGAGAPASGRVQQMGAWMLLSNCASTVVCDILLLPADARVAQAGTRATKRAAADLGGSPRINPRQPKAPRLNAKSGTPQPAPHPASAAAATGEAEGRHAASTTDAGTGGDGAKAQPPEVVLPQPTIGAEIPQGTAIRVGRVVRSWFDLDEGDNPVGFGVGDPCSHGEPAASSLPLVRSRVLRP